MRLISHVKPVNSPMNLGIGPCELFRSAPSLGSRMQLYHACKARLFLSFSSKNLCFDLTRVTGDVLAARTTSALPALDVRGHPQFLVWQDEPSLQRHLLPCTLLPRHYSVTIPPLPSHLPSSHT